MCSLSLFGDQKRGTVLSATRLPNTRAFKRNRSQTTCYSLAKPVAPISTLFGEGLAGCFKDSALNLEEFTFDEGTCGSSMTTAAEVASQLIAVDVASTPEAHL